MHTFRYLYSASRYKMLPTLSHYGLFVSIYSYYTTQIRKEKDEHSIAELRVQMAGMDRSLSTEIKRRIDLNRSAEKSCSAQISQMEERLSRIIDDRATLLEERLSAVETKVQELNLRLTEECERIPKDIEKRGEELGRMLKLLQSDLATERRDRLSREGRIAKPINLDGTLLRNHAVVAVAIARNRRPRGPR